jgi:hypothetical protein
MRRLVLAAVTMIATAPVVSAQSSAWADKLFKGASSHDFGTVPRGAQLYHQFQMTNIWAVPLQIESVRTSCGCVTATASQQILQPRESAFLDIKMDAHRFTGPKTVTIYVTVGPQFTSTATLRVSANSRTDVVFNPGQISFGVVGQGQAAVQTIDVEYAGVLDWRVNEVATNGAPVDVSYEELYRRPGQVGYRIRAALKPDARPGHVKQELTLKTNDQTSPMVPVLLEATIQASLRVTPGTVSLSLKVGEKDSRRVVVSADRPFKILAVDGVGDGIEAELPPSSAAVQVVTLKFLPGQTGELHRQLRIKTDLDKETFTTVTVDGNVEP